MAGWRLLQQGRQYFALNAKNAAVHNAGTAGSYNRAMRSTFLICLALTGSGLGAQTPAPPAAAPEALQRPEPLDGRRNQRIERIRHEDAGSRIDELRVGGQTQSITVQPKANVPEYGIDPPDLARTRPGDNRDGLSNATGQRFWNVLRF